MPDSSSLAGRYELRSRLGASPSAEVYLAQDRELDRPVAVKILAADLARDPEAVGRFRRASAAAAALRDPRIVTIYDTGTDDDAVFAAMEYVDGPSLADTLRDGRRLTAARAASIGADVALALDAAHRAGVVHGSLTPRDVLLTRAADVKVTDFGTAAAGLAGLADPATTARYAAPEQLTGGQPDARSDLYALGTVLYEAITGAAPFAGSDPIEITRRKLAERPLPPSATTRDVPPALDAIVERLLAVDLARRYTSAAEVAGDLRRLDDTLPVAVGEPTAAMPTAAPVAVATPVDEPRHRRTGWIIAAIVVLALVAAGIVAWLVRGDDETKAGQVVVPAVVGRAAPDAAAAVEAAGLSATTANEPNDQFGQGLVFSQAPAAGRKATKGSVVVLKVSAGPSTTTTTGTSTTTTTTSSSTTTTTTTSTTTTTNPPSSSSTS